jgi:hypothetical protein
MQYVKFLDISFTYLMDLVVFQYSVYPVKVNFISKVKPSRSIVYDKVCTMFLHLFLYCISNTIIYIRNQNNSVSIVTSYGLDGQGPIPGRVKRFLSRPALGPTQPLMPLSDETHGGLRLVSGTQPL